MEAPEFDEEAFFRGLDERGIRALLIGRRALVALGMPVLTADYDLWVHIDDVEKLNALGGEQGLAATRTPEEARGRGRYVLEGDEHVDVMIARSHTSKLGRVLTFDEAWRDRQRLPLGSASITLPSVDHLIETKRWALRERDAVDIQYLEDLRASRNTP